MGKDYSDVSDESFDKKGEKTLASERLGQTSFKERSCTDVLCGLIWFIFWMSVLFVVIFGYINGDTDKIAQPYDSDNKPCGKDDLS